MNNLLQLHPGDQRIFKRNFTVRYSEVNKFGTIKLQSVFDYLQQAAAEHANSLGFGMNSLYDKGIIWVLSKMNIKFFGSFSPEQKITVCTYPSGVERIFFRREFEIFDSSTNEVLVRASSFWLLLDAAKLRPLRRNILDGVQLENPDLPAFVENPQMTDDYELQEILQTKVLFSQMDINQHLNNAQYAAITENALYEKLQKEFSFETISVGFLQAQKYPDEITTSLAVRENGDFKLVGENRALDTACFNACGKIR